MSFWAYKDILRTNSITSEEAKSHSKDTDYFCPNTDCSAIMHISHCDGVSKARFRSLPSHPHIEKCKYYRGGYQKDQFDEKKFDFDSAIQDLMLINLSQKACVKDKNDFTDILHSSKNGKIKVLSTLSEIYNVLKSEAIDSDYNGIPIKAMLADERSAFFYTKGFWGYKIVETEYVHYRKDYKYSDEIRYVIYLRYPYSQLKHSIMLIFEDSKLSRSIQNLLYNNKNKKIIVAAYFNSIKDKNGEIKISARITSEKQIILM